jgi:homoserine O-acetyltransferase/O-succinyltransferase
MSDLAVFEAPDFALQKGGALPVARLAYKTIGTLSPARDNVVLIPSWYSGTHKEAEFCMVGPQRAITPDRYFIVLVNLLGGGVSSSPYNTPAPYNGPLFPPTTLYDNIRLQHMLLTQKLGIERIRLVAGWSMGGCQAFQWGAQYPDMVEAIAPLCCSARTANFNKVFLLSLRRALELDPMFNDGFYTRPPVRGLKAFAAIYAGWGFSEPFYRTEAFRGFGAKTYQEFVENFWETVMVHHDANNLLSMLKTWHDGDISDCEAYGGDFDRALGSIKARTIVMPCQYGSVFAQ